MESRIRWTADERASIKKKFDELRHQGLTFVAAVNEAMAVLPEERRRKIHTRQSVSWLDGTGAPRIRAKVEAILQQEQELQRQQEAALAEQERQRQEALAQEQMKREMMKADIISNLRLSDIISLCHSRLSDMIDGAISSKFEAILESGMLKDLVESRVETRALELATSPDYTPSAKRTKMLVVGFKKGVYQGELRRTFPHMEFQFMSSDEATTRNLPQTADHVVVLTKFIGHPAMHRIEKHFGKDIVTKHNGSIDTLKSFIGGMNDPFRGARAPSTKQHPVVLQH